MICSYAVKGCFYQQNKMKEQNLGLCEPNQKLPQATFALRPLTYTNLTIFDIRDKA